jgi:hypothetical protein
VRGRSPIRDRIDARRRCPVRAESCHGGGVKRGDRVDRTRDLDFEVKLPAMIEHHPWGGAWSPFLHVDADVICPRCLSWIGPEDYVRRNGMGLAQHETCRSQAPS